MSFIVENTSTGGDFTPVPAGLHLARCYRIVDLGTQQSEYMGETKHQRKIMLGWELHGKDDEGNELVTSRGDPLAIFKNYTLSWNEKATLRNDLQGWRNKPFTEEEMRRFDISTILGAWCMLNVIERPGKSGKMYSNVGSIAPVPSVVKQAGLPPAVNPTSSSAWLNQTMSCLTPSVRASRRRFSPHLSGRLSKARKALKRPIKPLLAALTTWMMTCHSDHETRTGRINT